MPDNSPPISGIQLGAGTLLVPLENLLAVFAPAGFNKQSFMFFLRALGVSWIETPGKSLQLVNYFKFILAIECATLNGEGIFMPKYAGNAIPHSDYPFKTTITIADYERLWRRAVSELLLVRRFPGLVNPPAIKQALDGAAKAIITQVARSTAAAVEYATLRAYEESQSILAPTEVDEDASPASYSIPPDPQPRDREETMKTVGPLPPLTYASPHTAVVGNHPEPPPDEDLPEYDPITGKVTE